MKGARYNSPMPKQIHVIINPAAGQNDPILNTLNNVFKTYDVRWEVDVTHGPGDAERHASAAVEAGVDVVAAYGGDGTIREVTCGLRGSGIPLAVLPA
jgi:diacylglycerol kinase (ATP)